MLSSVLICGIACQWVGERIISIITNNRDVNNRPDGGCERDAVHRMNEGHIALGVLKSFLRNRGLGIKAKKCLYEGLIVPTSLYGSEAWGMRSAERRKVNILEVKCLRSLVGVSRLDRVRN